MRSGRRWAEPEVWFRIVHVALDANGPPVAALPRTGGRDHPGAQAGLRKWQAILESGEASNQAAIARREGITRARVTQVMGLLRLTPEIQEHVLSLPDMVRRPAITERALRPIAQIESPRQQLQAFHALAVADKQGWGGLRSASEAPR